MGTAHQNLLFASTRPLLTSVSLTFCNGNVSTGLIQATPGEMKSFKSSADRMALMTKHLLPTTKSVVQRWAAKQISNVIFIPV